MLMWCGIDLSQAMMKITLFLFCISSGSFSFNLIFVQHRGNNTDNVKFSNEQSGIKKYSAPNLTLIIAVHNCIKQLLTHCCQCPVFRLPTIFNTDSFKGVCFAFLRYSIQYENCMNCIKRAQIYKLYKKMYAATILKAIKLPFWTNFCFFRTFFIFTTIQQ